MKRRAFPVAAALAFLVAGPAFATDATAAVKSVDGSAHTVTLSDGKIYQFAASVDVTKLQVGQKVKITFTSDASGKNTATAISPAA